MGEVADRKVVFRSVHIDHEPFLHKVFSSLLRCVRGNEFLSKGTTYVVDRGSLVGLSFRAGDANESGEEPVCHGVDRVDGRLILQLWTANGDMVADEVLDRYEIGSLYTVS